MFWPIFSLGMSLCAIELAVQHISLIMCPFPMSRIAFDHIITENMADSTTSLLGASGPPRAPNQFDRYFMSKPCVRSSKALNDQDRGYCLLHPIKRHQMLFLTQVLCDSSWEVKYKLPSQQFRLLEIIGDRNTLTDLVWPPLTVHQPWMTDQDTI